MIDEARDWARTLHQGQVDKLGVDYFAHVVDVAARVAPLGEEFEIVAFLHDAVEDTSVTLEDIEARFGRRVAAGVAAMTRRGGEDYLSGYLTRLADNEIARAVKVADSSHNLSKVHLLRSESEQGKFRAKYHSVLSKLGEDPVACEKPLVFDPVARRWIEKPQVRAYQMTFDGHVLERGFWLYLWEVRDAERVCYYVGRTGDSSSPNASSPFSRIGQHLDFRPNAKGNSLAKRLAEAGIEPRTSEFRMIALGPIFPEQDSFEQHKPYRDVMATLEHELAEYLGGRGYDVLGVHHRGSPVASAAIQEIIFRVDTFIKDGCAKGLPGVEGVS